VFVGISEFGLTNLIFLDLGLKINGGYYRDMLLSQQLLPVTHDVSTYQAISSPFNKTAHLHSAHFACEVCGAIS